MDEGIDIEMVQALDQSHAVDIFQTVQSGAVARAVLAASLDGRDRHRLLWGWMDALDHFMAMEGVPPIPVLLTLRLAAEGSEHDHPGS